MSKSSLNPSVATPLTAMRRTDSVRYAECCNTKKIVTFASPLVTMITERPRTTWDEKGRLFYSGADFQRFRMDKQTLVHFSPCIVTRVIEIPSPNAKELDQFYYNQDEISAFLSEFILYLDNGVSTTCDDEDDVDNKNITCIQEKANVCDQLVDERGCCNNLQEEQTYTFVDIDLGSGASCTLDYTPLEHVEGTPANDLVDGAFTRCGDSAEIMDTTFFGSSGRLLQSSVGAL